MTDEMRIFQVVGQVCPTDKPNNVVTRIEGASSALRVGVRYIVRAGMIKLNCNNSGEACYN